MLPWQIRQIQNSKQKMETLLFERRHYYSYKNSLSPLTGRERGLMGKGGEGSLQASYTGIGERPGLNLNGLACCKLLQLAEQLNHFVKLF